MTVAPTRRRRRIGLWAAAVVAILVVVAAGVLWWAPSRYLPWDTADFPGIDTSALTAEQAKVVELLRD